VAGDGTFTASISAHEGGIWRFLVTARGGASRPFSREEFLLSGVSSVRGQIVGNPVDRGVDTNFNGLFDRLDIDLDVTVEQSANVILLGELSDPTGELVSTATRSLAVSAGTTRTTLEFAGEDFVRAQRDGPYTLSVVRLVEDLRGERFPLDEKVNIYVLGRIRETISIVRLSFSPNTALSELSTTMGTARSIAWRSTPRSIFVSAGSTTGLVRWSTGLEARSASLPDRARWSREPTC
jgi:hypothetical protein